MPDENYLLAHALPEAVVNSQGINYDPRDDIWRVSSANVKEIDLTIFREKCTLLFFQSLKLALIVLNSRLKPASLRTYLFNGLRPLLEGFPGPCAGICRKDLEALWIRLGPDRKHWFRYLRPLCQVLYLHGIPGASITPDAVDYINSLKPGDPEADHLVNNWDPVSGPLTPDELDAFLRALDGAFAAGKINARAYVLILLFASFGARNSNLADLKICDLRLKNENGSLKYEMSIPSVKKRGARFRELFYTRPLGTGIGVLIEAYVSHLKEQYEFLGCGDDLPMFPDPDNHDPIRRFHPDSDSLGHYAVNTANRLEVVSTRTGGKLHVNARRYRYTQGTMARAMGLDPLAIAALLDHGSTETLHVYAAISPGVLADIMERLQSDRAPLAAGFLGRIADLGKAMDPQKTVFRARFRKDCPEPRVGECEASRQCGGRKPYACYPCPMFTASMEGDHEGALSDVLEERVLFDRDAGDALRFLTADSVAQAIRSVINLVQERLMEMGKTLEELRQEKEAIYRDKGFVL